MVDLLIRPRAWRVPGPTCCWVEGPTWPNEAPSLPCEGTDDELGTQGRSGWAAAMKEHTGVCGVSNWSGGSKGLCESVVREGVLMEGVAFP